jgi:thiol-disulfide isomerase/thioredoxin
MKPGLTGAPRQVALASLAALALAGAGLGVLYVKSGGEAKLGLAARAEGAECAESRAASLRVAPLATGEVAALIVAKTPAPMPEISFEAPGGVKKLSDFRGLLLNLWATWCIPCREEMPALDRLQKAAGGPDFEVVAVSIDTARLERRQVFLDTAGVKSLTFYADPKAEAFQILRAANRVEGLPTSWLIGKDGCEIGMLAAKADWGSADAAALIKAAVQ